MRKREYLIITGFFVMGIAVWVVHIHYDSLFFIGRERIDHWPLHLLFLHALL